MTVRFGFISSSLKMFRLTDLSLNSKQKYNISYINAISYTESFCTRHFVRLQYLDFSKSLFSYSSCRPCNTVAAGVKKHSHVLSS